MNITRLASADVKPSFGIRYNKPSKWHPEVLQTLMQSPLVKDIDRKYPKAIANYFVNGSMGSIRTLNLHLRDDMDIDILACSIFAPNAIKKFCDDILSLKLEDIEKHFPFKDTKYTTAEVDSIVKVAEANNCNQEEVIKNPLVRFFRYLFNPEARAESRARKSLKDCEEPIDIDIDMIELEIEQVSKNKTISAIDENNPIELLP